MDRKERNRIWRKKNRNRINQYLKAWRQQNKEKVAEYQKKGYRKNWYKIKLKQCKVLVS